MIVICQHGGVQDQYRLGRRLHDLGPAGSFGHKQLAQRSRPFFLSFFLFFFLFKPFFLRSEGEGITEEGGGQKLHWSRWITPCGTGTGNQGKDGGTGIVDDDV